VESRRPNFYRAQLAGWTTDGEILNFPWFAAKISRVNASDITIGLFNALRNGPRRKADVLAELFPVLRPSQDLLENSGRANIPKWQHRVLTEVAYLRRKGRIIPHQTDRRRWSLSATTADAAPAISAVEGRERLRVHKHRERSGTLRRQKIDDVLNRTGKLECECCGRDMPRTSMDRSVALTAKFTTLTSLRRANVEQS
jgi:hypothetical protein